MEYAGAISRLGASALVKIEAFTILSPRTPSVAVEFQRFSRIERLHTIRFRGRTE